MAGAGTVADRAALLRMADPEIAEMAEVSQPVWELAGTHRLRPLIAYRVRRGELIARKSLSPAPGDVFRATLARNLLVQATMTDVGGRLAERNIGYAVLKGIPLIEVAYPNLGTRPTGDIDVLVRRDDVPRAVEVLSGAGYRPIRPLPKPDSFHEVTLVVEGGNRPRPPIDLHWGLCSARFGPHARFDFSLAEERVWKGVDHTVPCLAPDMMFLHSLLHAFTNAFSQVSDFVDVAYLYRAVERNVNWGRFVEELKQFRMTRMAGFVFDQVRRWWNIPLVSGLNDLAEEGGGWAGRLNAVRTAAWRGDVGGPTQKILIPLFLEPTSRIPRHYLTMLRGGFGYLAGIKRIN